MRVDSPVSPGPARSATPQFNENAILKSKLDNLIGSVKKLQDAIVGYTQNSSDVIERDFSIPLSQLLKKLNTLSIKAPLANESQLVVCNEEYESLEKVFVVINGENLLQALSSEIQLIENTNREAIAKIEETLYARITAAFQLEFAPQSLLQFGLWAKQDIDQKVDDQLEVTDGFFEDLSEKEKYQAYLNKLRDSLFEKIDLVSVGPITNADALRAHYNLTTEYLSIIKFIDAPFCMGVEVALLMNRYESQNRAHAEWERLMLSYAQEPADQAVVNDASDTAMSLFNAIAILENIDFDFDFHDANANEQIKGIHRQMDKLDGLMQDYLVLTEAAAAHEAEEAATATAASAACAVSETTPLLANSFLRPPRSESASQLEQESVLAQRR